MNKSTAKWMRRAVNYLRKKPEVRSEYRARFHKARLFDRAVGKVSQ